MIQKMFAIRDTKGECYKSPFFKATHGEAERDFKELCSDEKSLVAKYPEDFDLYFIGEWDDNTGKVTPADTPQHMVKALQLLPSLKN